MMKQLISVALVLACASGSAADHQRVGVLVPVQEGVLRQLDADGSVTVVAYGAAGAAYDRAKITESIADVSARIAESGGNEVDAKNLADLHHHLALIPQGGGNGVKPMTASAGTVCGYPYGFDTQFAVGSVGGTVIARGVIASQGFAPLPPPLTSEETYASATITPYRGTPITHSIDQSNSLNNVIEVDLSLPNASSCTASTSSHIQAVTSICSGAAGYVSQTKSYATCTSSL